MANNVIKNVTLSNGNKADLNAKYWNGKETLKTINGKSLFGSGDISISTDITEIQQCVYYDELKGLRDGSELIPGKQYRIIDYVTTTSKENTQSAGHPFDIIVTALNEYTLCEEAHVIKNDGDGYFDGCDLSAWKIWYCLDNDTSRFSWANEDGGTGVIYRMIDEWGNDCPYDFKNIMFEKWLYTDGGGITTEDGADFSMYCYTFSWQDAEDVIMDASIVGNNGYVTKNYGYGENGGVYGNIIGIYIDGTNGYPFQELNSIVFLSTYRYREDNGIYNGCYSNMFGDNCYNNIFNSSCYSNTFGNSCFNNHFGNDCYENTFGNSCFDNTFVYSCYSNTFGDYCNLNTFGEECDLNTFGNSCHENTFGIDCNSNTFGNDCYNNELRKDCNSNTFGNYCYDNKLGSESYSNTFGDSCHSNTFNYDCNSNILGKGCYSNTFGSECYKNTLCIDCNNNTFGDNCYGNTLGYNCYENKFGYSCYSNKFGNSCHDNTFDEDCDYNEFGNGCHNNTFDEDCNRNTFGNGCNNNTFGNEFDSNSFGNNCININFGNGCCYNSFGNGCFNIVFSQPNGLIPYLNNIHFGDRVVNIGLVISTSEDSLKNINVTQGFNSSNEEYVEINMDEYVGITDKEITITKDHEGNVRVFCLADVLAQHGFI